VKRRIKMSDRSPYSPERRALFVALGALGAGLPPVLTAATSHAEPGRVEEEKDRPGRPPIIIKGGSFSVELDTDEPYDFTTSSSDPAYHLQANPNTTVPNLEVKVIGFTDEGVDFKTPRLMPVTDVTMTLEFSNGTSETVVLSAKGVYGLSVTKGKLEMTTDGPARRRRRLKHQGYGNTVGFWISSVDVKNGMTPVFSHPGADLDFRLKVWMNEVPLTPPSPPAR
jgi:hypothetical protein